MTQQIVLFLLGLLLLCGGGELLVRSASNLARGLGVSPLFIGLTVVAFGTSAPEIVVSAMAALNGSSGLVIGNVVGSNIFNVLVILGVSALIVPLAISSQVIRYDLPVLAGASLLCYLLARNGSVAAWEGVVLLFALLVNTAVGYRLGLVNAKESDPGPDGKKKTLETDIRRKHRPGIGRDAVLVVLSLVLLLIGSRFLVSSATAFAHWLGLSDLVIGLTVVAVGTSLPEVVTSVMAAIRGERDIAVGNVIGSNLFNTLGVLGIAAVLAPSGLSVPPEATAFDLPVMVAVAFLCLPIFINGKTVYRWEGALLVFYFALYTAYLLLDATHSTMLPSYRAIVGWGVLPATILAVLVITTAHLFRARRGVPSVR